MCAAASGNCAGCQWLEMPLQLFIVAVVSARRCVDGTWQRALCGVWAGVYACVQMVFSLLGDRGSLSCVELHVDALNASQRPG